MLTAQNNDMNTDNNFKMDIFILLVPTFKFKIPDVYWYDSTGSQI